MKRNCLLLLCMSCICTLFSQSWDEWKNPEINERNRLPMHTAFFAYADGWEGTDIPADPSAASNYLSLDGIWKFHWVRNADQRPKDFYRLDYDDARWGKMPVPGMWELNGYGDPLYVNYGYAWRGHAANTPPVVPEFYADSVFDYSPGVFGCTPFPVFPSFPA